jgi:hypothetical protein
MDARNHPDVVSSWAGFVAAEIIFLCTERNLPLRIDPSGSARYGRSILNAFRR